MYSLLALINLLTPKPRASHRVAQDRRYGPDTRQTLDIYAPRSGQGPWPILYFVYGGAWNIGDRRYYEFVGRILAAAGYVVVVVEYRLVPEVEYPAFLDDAAAGFAWVVEHAAEFGGDPQRMALMGHSAGAYNAMMLLLGPSLLPRLGLADRVRAVAGLSGPYDFYPFDVPVSLRTFGAVRDPKSTQPVNLVRPGLPPMLLVSGDSDRVVYPRNAVALAARLRAGGNVVVEKHYPGIGHAGTLLALGPYGRHRAPILADTLAFLRAHL
ncbi:MAG: alpha/beta hydrolase [Hyphomicrobiales bacterium]|nr:MAG: alpha/beta hydrolase [Hyphomicrobiales bacterium]